MKVHKDEYKDMDRDKLIYELERYKKAVHTRDIMIEKMREEMQGQYQVGQIMAAYIAILIGEEEREIGKSVIKNAVGKYTASIRESDSKECYIIKAVRMEEVKDNEGVESEDKLSL